MESSTDSPHNDDDKENESDNSENTFTVEKILKMKMTRGGKRFFVRWLGYGPDEDQWVKESDMMCPDILAAFYKEEEERKNAQGRKRTRTTTRSGNEKKAKATSISQPSPATTSSKIPENELQREKKNAEGRKRTRAVVKSPPGNQNGKKAAKTVPQSSTAEPTSPPHASTAHPQTSKTTEKESKREKKNAEKRKRPRSAADKPSSENDHVEAEAITPQPENMEAEAATSQPENMEVEATPPRSSDLEAAETLQPENMEAEASTSQPLTSSKTPSPTLFDKNPPGAREGMTRDQREFYASAAAAGYFFIMIPRTYSLFNNLAEEIGLSLEESIPSSSTLAKVCEAARKEPQKKNTLNEISSADQNENASKIAEKEQQQSTPIKRKRASPEKEGVPSAVAGEKSKKSNVDAENVSLNLVDINIDEPPSYGIVEGRNIIHLELSPASSSSELQADTTGHSSDFHIDDLPMDIEHQCFGTSPSIYDFAKNAVIHNVNIQKSFVIEARIWKLRCNDCTKKRTIHDDTVEYVFCLLSFQDKNYLMIKLHNSPNELFLIEGDEFQESCPRSFMAFASITRNFIDTLGDLTQAIEEQKIAVEESYNNPVMAPYKSENGIAEIEVNGANPPEVINAGKEICRLFFLELQKAIGKHMGTIVDCAELESFVMDYYEKRDEMFKIVKKEAVKGIYEVLYAVLISEETEE